MLYATIALWFFAAGVIVSELLNAIDNEAVDAIRRKTIEDAMTAAEKANKLRWILVLTPTRTVAIKVGSDTQADALALALMRHHYAGDLSQDDLCCIERARGAIGK